MGNSIYSSSSQPTDMKSLASQIDDIAVHYILKQNTIDLLRLTDKEYYDNLIILVGNLFEKKLSDIEIGSLNQRIFPDTVQDAVLNILPSNGKIKDIMISNISKFYIKIMMIFSAIVSTIDPQYSYDDDTGKQQLFYLKDIKSYKKIPKNVQPVVHQLTNPMNLCRKRISILRNKIDSSDPDFITINPGEKLCATDSASHLTDEIGIKELDLLYYDVFDPETKTWKGRSKGMDDKYRDDLKKFYTIFTGKSELPQNITSFKDIELFDFKSMDYCKDTLFTHDFIVPKDNDLILRYKEQVDLLEQSTTTYRAELLETLKKIFLSKIDDDNMSYTIQPSLTLDDILEIETETRNTIINLYTNCEQYFIRALLIFEELYDHQSKNMNESRLNHIDKNSKNKPLYTEGLINMNTVQPMPPLNMSTNMDENLKSNSTPNVEAFTPTSEQENNPDNNPDNRSFNNPPEPSNPSSFTSFFTQNAKVPPIDDVNKNANPSILPEVTLPTVTLPTITLPTVTLPPMPSISLPTPSVTTAPISVNPVSNVTPEVTPNIPPNMTPPVVTPNMTPPEVTPNMTPPNMTPIITPPEVTPIMTPPNMTPPEVTPIIPPNMTPPEVTPNIPPNMTPPEVTPNMRPPEVTPNITPNVIPPANPTIPEKSSNGILETLGITSEKQEIPSPMPEEKKGGLVESIRKIWN